MARHLKIKMLREKIANRKLRKEVIDINNYPKKLNIGDGNSSLCLKAEVSLPLMR